jgi:3-oxoacyl-[acyl-carrier-protein] synthase II
MLMETEANAKARGASVYCEVAGFGSAYGVELDEQLGLGAMPTADAVAAAITSALEVAGVKPEEVGFVSAHGTGVPAADAAELAGIKKAFGAHAGKLLVSSTRAQLGNAMAANSGLDALVCAKALRDGVVPGTARLEQAPPPLPRTNRTSLAPPLVLTGQVSSRPSTLTSTPPPSY